MLHLNSSIVPLNIVNNAADKKEIGMQLNNVKICGLFMTQYWTIFINIRFMVVTHINP